MLDSPTYLATRLIAKHRTAEAARSVLLNHFDRHRDDVAQLGRLLAAVGRVK